MNPRIWKELRVIAPYLALQLTLIILYPILIRHLKSEWWLLASFPLIYITTQIIGCAPFASERSDNTLHRLMSEPVPRSQLWRHKVFVSAAALMLSIVTAGLMWLAWRHVPARFEVAETALFKTVALFSVVAIGGGAVMPLLIPQPFTSITAACVVPLTAFLIVMISITWSGFFPEIYEWRITGTLAVAYSLICLAASYHVFRRMEVK